ncbi:uncharacterized protein LOC115920717 [Strongylocentrotus purpuratus]|uniref:Uncharacterized protein n=1 Tax=Strongylocentrotus purpuratus TaxID=7668 RepID=A0A7M7N9B9_STRPU|nr:uncharacterized protein LOC115920717 [Strongylocentrotus purpuratus]
MDLLNAPFTISKMKSFCMLLAFVVIIAFVGTTSATFETDALLDEPRLLESILYKRVNDDCHGCGRSCKPICYSLPVRKRARSQNVDTLESLYQPKQASSTCRLDKLYNLMSGEEKERIIETFAELL